MAVNQYGWSSSSRMRAFDASGCFLAALKALWFVLSSCCTSTTAMVLPTQSLFNRHTATFNVTNPIHLQNIKPKKVLAVFEEAFREVLADVQNEASDTKEQKEKQRRYRHRRHHHRMLHTDKDLVTDGKEALTTNGMKAVSHPEQVYWRSR